MRPSRAAAGVRLGAIVALGLMLLVAVPSPVSAGSEDDPEILDDPRDTLTRYGRFIPQLDVIKGWAGHTKEDLIVKAQVASSSDILPPRTQIVYHFTYKNTRVFAAVNQTDQGQMDWHYGTFTGLFQERGNRVYAYVRVGDADGAFSPGTPATYTWRIPTDVLGKPTDGDQMKGMFLQTYEAGSQGQREHVDFAFANRDYTIEIKSLREVVAGYLPGPPLPLVVAAVALAGVAAARLRRR